MSATFNVNGKEIEIYGDSTYSPFLQRAMSLEKLIFRILHTSKNQYPDFLGIGAPQSGSTWLYKCLGEHPELFLPRKKELHFFDRNYHFSMRSYLNNFRGGEPLVKGEITPGYSILEDKMIERIFRFFPEVKVIYQIRNPLDQRISTMNRILSNYTKDNPFEIVSVNDLKSLMKNNFGLKGNYELGLRRFDYLRIIKKWRKYLEKDKLLITYYDDIIDRPDQLLSSVYSFLGLSNTSFRPSVIDLKINSNPRFLPPTEVIQDFAVHIINDVEKLQEILGNPPQVKRWVQEIGRWT